MRRPPIHLNSNRAIGYKSSRKFLITIVVRKLKSDRKPFFIKKMYKIDATVHAVADRLGAMQRGTFSIPGRRKYLLRGCLFNIYNMLEQLTHSHLIPN